MKIIDVHTHLYWQNGHDSGRQIPHAPPGPIGPEAYMEAFDRLRLAGEGRMVISPGSGLEEFKKDPDMVRRANDAVAKLVAMAPDRFILGCGPDPFRLEDTLALMEEYVAPRGAKIVGEIVPCSGGYDREGPAMDAIYRKAITLGVPISNHSSTAEEGATEQTPQDSASSQVPIAPDTADTAPSYSWTQTATRSG